MININILIFQKTHIADKYLYVSSQLNTLKQNIFHVKYTFTKEISMNFSAFKIVLMCFPWPWEPYTTTIYYSYVH